jgi:hypothetical protein
MVEVMGDGETSNIQRSTSKAEGRYLTAKNAESAKTKKLKLFVMNKSAQGGRPEY